MTPKQTMHDKFDRLNDLNLTNNLLLLHQMVKNWCDLKPDNEELKKLRECALQITLLTNSLQLDRGNYHIALAEYRTEKIRSIERARRAEAKVEELEKQLSIYKKKEELGL